MNKEEILKRVDEAVKKGATELHIVGSHNPDVNIEYGCRYLSLLFTRYGAQSYEETIQWYNAGPHNESKEYLEKVRSFYEEIRSS